MTSPAVDLRNLVLDTLGGDICAGRIPAGTIFTADSIEARFQVSRSVVREALRGLEAVGLVAPRRRVGMRVLPSSEWSAYDLQVIRWRLAGPDRAAQLRSLTELREAIEPAASRLAAMHASRAHSSELVGIAGLLWAAGTGGDEEEFLQLDVRFHRLVLEMGGNEMFTQLHHLIEEVLRGRTQYHLMPRVPSPAALQWHVDIATAIQTGDADTAAERMLSVTRRSLAEMSAIWRTQDPGFTAHA